MPSHKGGPHTKNFEIKLPRKTLVEPIEPGLKQMSTFMTTLPEVTSQKLPESWKLQRRTKKKRKTITSIQVMLPSNPDLLGLHEKQPKTTQKPPPVLKIRISQKQGLTWRQSKRTESLVPCANRGTPCLDVQNSEHLVCAKKIAELAMVSGFLAGLVPDKVRFSSVLFE